MSVNTTLSTLSNGVEVNASSSLAAVMAAAAASDSGTRRRLGGGMTMRGGGGVTVGDGVAHNVTGDGGAAVHEHPSGGVILFIISFLIASQLGLQVWRKRHPQSYNQVTVLGLWLIPFILSVREGFVRFIIVWLVFTCATAFFVRQATRLPLAPGAPRTVYTFFSVVYKACYFLGASGYVAVVTQGMVGPFSTRILEYSMLAVFYGLYFGVLGRDVAEVCAERMSATLGYIRKKDDDSHVQPPPPNICSLCGQVLRPGTPYRADPRHPANAEDATPVEELIELPCGHTFHEFCLLGWTIVGKKDTCPFCSEKVELSKIAGTSSWRKQSVAWSWLLSMVRYFMSWHPVFLMILHFMFLELGLQH